MKSLTPDRDLNSQLQRNADRAWEQIYRKMIEKEGTDRENSTGQEEPAEHGR